MAQESEYIKWIKSKGRNPTVVNRQNLPVLYEAPPSKLAQFFSGLKNGAMSTGKGLLKSIKNNPGKASLASMLAYPAYEGIKEYVTDPLIDAVSSRNNNKLPVATNIPAGQPNNVLPTENAAVKNNPFAGSTIDPNNKQSIKKLQTTLGIKSDGIIGPITMKAMEDAGIGFNATPAANKNAQKKDQNKVAKSTTNDIKKSNVAAATGYSEGADEAMFAAQDKVNMRALNPNPGEKAFIEENYNKSIANNEFANNMEALTADNSAYAAGSMTQEDKQAEFFNYLANRKSTVNDPASMMINGDIHGDGGEFRQYQEDVAVAKARGINPELVDMFRKQQSQQERN